LRQLQNAQVALVDGSLQFGDVAVLLNLQATRTIADLAPHVEELDQEMLNSVLMPHSSGIKALLAPPRPEMADLIAPGVMNAVLNKLRFLYNYVIVDTWSSLHDITLTILDAADRIILITTPDIPSIYNTKLFFEVTEALEYPTGKAILVLNKADRRTNIRAEDIQASIKYPVSSQLPLDERVATTAANQGVPYMLSEREGPLAQATTALARYMVSTMVEVA